MAGRVLQTAIRPVGRVGGDDLGKLLAPALDQRLISLEMKLDAVDRATQAERLELRLIAGGEMHRAMRQRERVEVPVEHGRAVTQSSDHRIAPAGGRGRHFVPTEFDRAVEDICRPRAASDKLGAEADAEHGLVGLAKRAREGGDPWQMRMVGIVKGALLAAEDDKAVVALMARRNGCALPREPEVDLGASVDQRFADNAGWGADVVLDDKDAHCGGVVARRPSTDEDRTTMRVGEASTPAGLRLYAIGDMHGCNAELAAVHGAIAADLAARPSPNHRIIHIGDYGDRGPDSAGVIGRLVRMAANDPPVICLRGNHDQMLVDFLADPAEHAPMLLRNGGKETLRSYGVGLRSRTYEQLQHELVEKMPPADRAFLEALPTSVQFGDYFFCHAGIRPGVPLASQDPYDLLWIREEFLLDGRDHGVVVVHGHTVTPTLQPEVHTNRIAIDSGAVFGGPLTCLVLEGREHRFL
jgi:serine/threonine protein phosphatase 1